MTSRPPILGTSLDEAVRIALPYLRIAHAGLVERLPSDDECVGGVFVAITTLEKALSREEPTARTEIPKR